MRRGGSTSRFPRRRAGQLCGSATGSGSCGTPRLTTARTRRLPLCLEPNQAAATELAGFEKALVAQLAARSQTDPKLFGRMLTTQDTESRFVSCLKTSTRGNSFIKLKVCLDQVRLWDAQGQSLPEMGDLSNRECKVRAELKQVWMMSGQCGLLVEVTDLMLKEEEPQRCPF